MREVFARRFACLESPILSTAPERSELSLTFAHAIVCQDEHKIPFRKKDQCGWCALVTDSFPGKTWEDICDDYEADVDGFQGEFDRCREIAYNGTSAWLPKPVRSLVRLGVDFAQVFLFLSIALFTIYFPKCQPKKIKKIGLVTVFNYENKEEEGFLLKPTQKGRDLNLPEVRVWRESVIYIEEDLCPSNQIREGQSKQIWDHRSSKRVKDRHPALKDQGCRKAPSLEKLRKMVKRTQASERRKLDAVGIEEVSSDSEVDKGTRNRALVDADIDAEAPTKRKKVISRAMKLKIKERLQTKRKMRKGLLGRGAGDGLHEALGASGKGGVQVGGGAAEDSEEDDADASGDLSGSEGEIQRRTKIPVEQVLRGVTGMGNRVQGVAASGAASHHKLVYYSHTMLSTSILGKARVLF